MLTADHLSIRYYWWPFWGWRFLAGVLCCLCLWGCTNTDFKTDDDFLIRVGECSISTAEYRHRLAMACSAYEGQKIEKSALFEGIKKRLFDQLIEELILCQKSRELGLAVSDKELATAVARIKDEYPKGAFDEMLLENAVIYQEWEDALRRRLLMEKVAEHEFSADIKVTPDELRDFYQTQLALPSDADNAKAPARPLDERQSAKALTTLKHIKMEARYQNWMQQLKSQYPPRINQKEWKKIR